MHKDTAMNYFDNSIIRKIQDDVSVIICKVNSQQTAPYTI